MPIYFEELERIIQKWFKLCQIEVPIKSPASWVSYKTFIKSVKKDMLEQIVKIFEKIDIKNVIMIPDLDKNDRFYIKITTPVKSKL
tara:strand:+ start:190 stop:447 length:258 start_codon:yes stop_codon:yes gene_type:complete